MNSLIRFPRSNMRTLQREMDRVFDSFFGSADERNISANTSAVWRPRTDLSETDDAYLIHVDVPGVEREDLEINVQGGTLSVSGERRTETSASDEKHNHLRVERSYGRLYRSFTLPNEVDVDGIEATCKDGVLDIHIPKTEEVKPRRIEVA